MAGAGVVEQVHAESDAVQMEPAELRQVDPVPQNLAEGPASQLSDFLMEQLHLSPTNIPTIPGLRKN